MIRCCNCRFRIPDPVGWGTGVGSCMVYEKHKKHGATEQKLKQVFIELGNELFLGGDGGRVRSCTKFEVLKNGS